MGDILKLTEEDIKLRYITPSICDKGWSFEDISMEAKVKLTDGRINLSGNFVARGKAKYADYLLYLYQVERLPCSIPYGEQQL